jgi:hypothetical protein
MPLIVRLMVPISMTDMEAPLVIMMKLTCTGVYVMKYVCFRKK